MRQTGQAREGEEARAAYARVLPLDGKDVFLGALVAPLLLFDLETSQLQMLLAQTLDDTCIPSRNCVRPEHTFTTHKHLYVPTTRGENPLRFGEPGR
jgi:hypothetical protein